jgi:hypothetical protein
LRFRAAAKEVLPEKPIAEKPSPEKPISDKKEVKQLLV